MMCKGLVNYKNERIAGKISCEFYIFVKIFYISLIFSNFAASKRAASNNSPNTQN